MYLLKTASSGEFEWQRTFGGDERDFGRSVQQTSDGGYVLCGDTRSFGAGESDVYLVKLAGDRPVRFRRGDADDNGEVEVTDAVRVLEFLFAGGEALPCAEAADADDNGTVQLTDAVRILTFLFAGGPALPAPGAENCGPDPQAPGLGCAEYTSC